jgi:hypothetical protein
MNVPAVPSFTSWRTMMSTAANVPTAAKSAMTSAS